MGIHAHLARALIAARAGGLKLGRTLMLGRLRLYATPTQIQRYLDEYGIAADARGLAGAEYAEPFLTLLGAEQVEALDASSFEGAQIIHDLNQPVPAAWHQRYDLVLDGGTLEHVFFFPTALQNAMSLVRPGGALFLCLPANNFVGHGFYTFSPELFYAALAPNNGYQMVRMLVAEYYPNAPWYEVQNPAVVGKRVGFISDGHQTHLMVHATRTHAVPIFAQTPQQNDYQAAWREGPLVLGPRTRWYDRYPWARAVSQILRNLRQSGPFRRRRNLRRSALAAQPALFIPVDR